MIDELKEQNKSHEDDKEKLLQRMLQLEQQLRWATEKVATHSKYLFGG
jgi:prefoldin subunit 5